MTQNLYDRIYEKLQEPVKIYLSKETKEMLEQDWKNFGVEKRNQFYNLLICNYIDEYTNRLEETGNRILRQMKELISARNENEFPLIARKLAFESNSIADPNEKEAFISIRVNGGNVHQIAGTISEVADELKVSVFFRNLFLNYLTLPSYRREQIIYAEQYNAIMQAINNNQKLSYRNKKSKKSHMFNPYSIEQSAQEYHNYLVGSFDHVPGVASIKLISIETVRTINESASYSKTFEECYNAMKMNGCQFGITELKYWKCYLSPEELKTYNGRYLDRPAIFKQGEDEKGNWYIFNCSKFQRDGFFNPFGTSIEFEECVL